MQRNGLESGVPKNFKGKKGRSGRKKKAEEVRLYLENIKGKITNEALIELARDTVFTAIKDNPNLVVAEKFALPVTLKGIADKSENKQIIEIVVMENQLKRIYDGELTDNTVSESAIQRIGTAVRIDGNASRNIQNDLEEEISESSLDVSHQIREELSRSISDTSKDKYVSREVGDSSSKSSEGEDNNGLHN